jgi:hypothetical protein
VTYAVRRVGVALAIGIGVALALGLTLALAQGESVLLWFAYMLDIAGALAIAFAIFSGAPTSARKAIVRRYLKKDEPEPEVAQGATVVSDLLLFVCAGIVLLALGLVVELAAT